MALPPGTHGEAQAGNQAVTVIWRGRNSRIWAFWALVRYRTSLFCRVLCLCWMDVFVTSKVVRGIATCCLDVSFSRLSLSFRAHFFPGPNSSEESNLIVEFQLRGKCSAFVTRSRRLVRNFARPSRFCTILIREERVTGGRAYKRTGSGVMFFCSCQRCQR